MIEWSWDGDVCVTTYEQWVGMQYEFIKYQKQHLQEKLYDLDAEIYKLKNQLQKTIDEKKTVKRKSERRIEMLSDNLKIGKDEYNKQINSITKLRKKIRRKLK